MISNTSQDHRIVRKHIPRTRFQMDPSLLAIDISDNEIGIQKMPFIVLASDEEIW